MIFFLSGTLNGIFPPWATEGRNYDFIQLSKHLVWWGPDYHLGTLVWKLIIAKAFVSVLEQYGVTGIL